MGLLGEVLNDLYSSMATKSTFGDADTPQTAVIYDLISEGPIEGLVGGAGGIYINGTPLVATYNAGKVTPKRTVSAVFTNGSTTVTANGFFADLTPGKHYIVLERGKANSSIFSGTAGSTRITATGFFSNSYFVNDTQIEALAPKLRIDGLGPDGQEYIGKLVTRIDANTAEVLPAISTSGSSKAGGLDHVTYIASTTSNTATISVAPSVSGTKIQVLPEVVGNNERADDRWNFKNVWASFRTGRRDQYPVLITGVPSASFLTEINQDLLWANTFGGDQSPVTYSAASLGITTPSEIDAVKITLEFPAGLYVNGGESGNIGQASLLFQIKFIYTQNGTQKTALLMGPADGDGPGYGTGVKYKHWVAWARDNYATHTISRRTTVSFVEEIEIPIEQFKPFTDFSITLNRVFPDDSVDYDFDDAILFSASRLKHIEAQIIDKFSYPYSAYAVVAFPAEGFNTPPTRAYKARGLKVKVPSNYTTREENGGTSLYTGAWDGSFRTAYCNNPAWVFYDLATNKRYGLGKYIDSAYVNKYALYTIARYCDELVTDGKGGLEPRFTCNVYLASEEEAYKVLNDLATTFRGLLYWMEGQLTAIQDSPKEPVYNFTQGNIIDGVFSYEYTGNLTRYNEVNVTWNNPDQFYQQDILTVTDATDIIKRNKVVSMDTLAFGCTSAGQAYRVGNWNILTAQQETEILKFRTSLNAGFIKPGDIINVQDQHDYQIQASGRLKSAANSTTVTLDRNVSLVSGSAYRLHLVFDGPGCYLQQNTANVSGIIYSRGDYIPGVTTEADAATLLDTSGNPVAVSFNKHVRVEKKTVNTALPYTGNTITVSSGYSATPNTEVIWALENITLDNNYKPKKYRVLGIAEEEPHIYSLIAVNYAEAKYEELEKKVTIKDPTYTGPRPTDEVPGINNLSCVIAREGDESSNEFQGYRYDAVVSWDPPIESFTDSNANTYNRIYTHLDQYEIQHDLRDPTTLTREFETQVISAGTTSLIVQNVVDGTYTIKVRVKNTLGQYSRWVTKIFELTTRTTYSGGTVFGLPRGGALDSGILFNSNTFSIIDSNYSYTSPLGVITSVTGATANQSSQSFSGLTANSVYYLLWDQSANASDPLQAVYRYEDATVASPVGATNKYWVAAGAANNGMIQLSGTITVSINTNKITGSGTTFAANLAIGNLIRLGSANTAYYATVASITSNTELYTIEVIQKAFSAQTIWKQSVSIDYNADSILAKITTNGSSTASLSEQYVISTVNEPQVIVLSATGQAFSYDGGGSLIGPSQIDFTVNRQNLINGTTWAVFDSNNNNIGNTYLASKTNTSATLNSTSFASIANNSVVKIQVSADGYLDYISIYELQDGADGSPGAPGANGANAITLTIISDRQTITYDTTGAAAPAVQNTTFTANKINTSNTVTWLIYDINNNAKTPTTNYLSANTGDSVTMNVTAFDSARGANSGVIVTGTVDGITDKISVVKVQDGDATVVGFLTQEAFVASANSTGGSIDYTGNNGTFKVFDGVTDITTGNGTLYNVVGNTASGGWSNTTTNGLTFSINNTTGAYQVSGASWSTNTASFTANAVTNASHGSLTIQKVYTITKSIAGPTGSPGANGANGYPGFSIISTQEAVIVPAESNGSVVSYANTGTTINVFFGTTQLTYDNVASYSNNTFRMNTTLSGTNITPGSVSNNANSLIIGNHSSMTADQAYVVIPITIVDSVGSTIGPVNIYQYLNKSRSGTSSIFVEDFRDNSASRVLNTWHHTGTNVTNSLTVEANTTSNTGSGFVWVIGDNSGNDQETRAASRYLGYSIEDNILYRVVYVIRRTSGAANAYLGVASLDHNRSNWIQTSGTTTAVVDNGANEAALANSHWFAAENYQVSNTAWELRIGYFMRSGATANTKSGNTSPGNYGILHANTKYVVPSFRVNSSGAAGQYKIAYIGIAPAQGAPNTSYVGSIPVDAINSLITNDGTIADGGQIGDGSNYKLISKGVAVGSASDGEAVTFTSAWEAIPTINFFSGGVSQEAYLDLRTNTATWTNTSIAGNWAHGLSGIPDFFAVQLIANTTTNGYVANDVVDMRGARLDGGGADFTVWANTTHIGYASRTTGANLQIENKAGGTDENIEATTSSNWKLRYVAAKWVTGTSLGTNGVMAQDYQALGVSTTGFTASLKIRQLSGTPTLQSNSSFGTEAIPAGGPTGQSITKVASTEAYDDKYIIQYDCTVVNDDSGDWKRSGVVDIGVYSYVGAGPWVKRGTITKVGTTSNPTTTFSNNTFTVSLDGAGANTRFGLVIEYDKIGGSSINFDSLKWYTASVGSALSATPELSGIPSAKVPYLVIGGQE